LTKPSFDVVPEAALPRAIPRKLRPTLWLLVGFRIVHPFVVAYLQMKRQRCEDVSREWHTSISVRGHERLSNRGGVQTAHVRTKIFRHHSISLYLVDHLSGFSRNNCAYDIFIHRSDYTTIHMSISVPKSDTLYSRTRQFYIITSSVAQPEMRLSLSPSSVCRLQRAYKQSQQITHSWSH
jgi:hypothetical protein